MSKWYVSQEGGDPEGPMSAEEVGKLLGSGKLKGQEAHVWEEGAGEEEQEKGVEESGGVVGTPQSNPGRPRKGIVLPKNVGRPMPVPKKVPLGPPVVPPASKQVVDPYVPPAPLAPPTVETVPSVRSPLDYPGLGRLGYFIWQIVVSIGAMGLLLMVGFGSSVGRSMDGRGGPDGAFAAFLVVCVVASIGGAYLAVRRVQNVGMSGWAVLWCLVPIMNVWIIWRMWACPAGYHEHQRLDAAGKVLTGLLILYFVVSIGWSVYYSLKVSGAL